MDTPGNSDSTQGPESRTQLGAPSAEDSASIAASNVHVMSSVLIIQTVYSVLTVYFRFMFTISVYAKDLPKNF
jgi:hypothetical protein